LPELKGERSRVYAELDKGCANIDTWMDLMHMESLTKKFLAEG